MGSMLENVVTEKAVAGRREIEPPTAAPSATSASLAAPPTLKERLASKLSPVPLMEKALPTPEGVTTPPPSASANNGHANPPIMSPGEDGTSAVNEADLQEKDFGKIAPSSPQP